jgi:hypothetical protein
MRALGARWFDHATSDWQLLRRVLCNEAPSAKADRVSKWALGINWSVLATGRLVDWTAINLDSQM